MFYLCYLSTEVCYKYVSDGDEMLNREADRDRERMAS